MKKYKQYLGILLGALYGVGYRVFCETSLLETELGDVFSITFVVVLPLVISYIPIMVAQDEVLKKGNGWKLFVFPVASVTLFFVITIATQLEDIFCLFIFGFPFLLIAGGIGFLIGSLLKRNRKSKNYLNTIVLLPFLLYPLESVWLEKSESYQVSSELRIEAPIEIVWDNLIEVPEITDSEFDTGFFNFIGVPRPVKSVLRDEGGEIHRWGIFTDGLELCESIESKDSLQQVTFRVHLDRSKLRDEPTDRHVLRGDNFSFETIRYRTSALEDGATLLKLECDYVIESHMNFYANFWAKWLIQDFEERLLMALKKKLESPSS